MGFDYNVVTPAFDKVGSIANFDLVWWGNADRNPTTGKVTCQHGEVECAGNLYFGCGQALYPEATHMKFVHCFDWSCIFGCPGGCDSPLPKADYTKFIKNCSSYAGMDQTKVTTCATGAQGKAILAAAEKKTPSHDYVPWVVIDGKHDKRAEASERALAGAVCRAYKGTDKPAGCKLENLAMLSDAPFSFRDTGRYQL